MKNLILLLSLMFFAFACGNSKKPATSAKKTSKKSTAKAAPDGKKIFKTYCVACHGLYGDMEVNGAKDLNLSILPVAERIEIITNGKNVMTPFKNVLTEEQIQAVAEYTAEAFKK